MKPYLGLIAMTTLVGCCNWQADRAKQHEIFVECMQLANKQPEHNHEDNNGHLIEMCNDVAKQQSLILVCQ